MAVRKYSLEEIVGVVLKRRWLILVPLALGVALVPVLARLAPERFRSEALIVVIPQQVPNDYVRPTVSESVAQRLPAITDQILSRSRLESIIQELNLYPYERTRWVMEDVVQRMRRDVTTTAGGRQVNSFRVSYLSDTPEKARLVTERLARLYIDQNSEARASQADSTSEFLDAQLAQAKERLIEQEKKLEEYRRAHSGQLPSQMQSNLQAIQNANTQLQAVNEATNRALERRLLIERQLADVRALPLPQPQAPAGAEAGTAISTARQLEIAQAHLTLLLQRNTPDHPEVVSLVRLIEELTVRLANEPPDASAETTAPQLTAAEIAQQRRISGLEAELAVVDHQLAANRTEADRLQQRIAEYQVKVDAVPSRESELVELTRDYGTMQTAYTELLMKRENSVIAANLERRRIGEQFRLVDAASRPERPDNQRQRIVVMTSGAVGGLLFGLLAVGLLEFRDSSFRRPDEVIHALSLPVLASIPAMASDRERRRAAWRRRLADAGGTLVVLFSVAVLVLWRLQ